MHKIQDPTTLKSLDHEATQSLLGKRNRSALVQNGTNFDDPCLHDGISSLDALQRK